MNVTKILQKGFVIIFFVINIIYYKNITKEFCNIFVIKILILIILIFKLLLIPKYYYKHITTGFCNIIFVIFIILTNITRQQYYKN